MRGPRRQRGEGFGDWSLRAEQTESPALPCQLGLSASPANVLWMALGQNVAAVWRGAAAHGGRV